MVCCWFGARVKNTISTLLPSGLLVQRGTGESGGNIMAGIQAFNGLLLVRRQSEEYHHLTLRVSAERNNRGFWCTIMAGIQEYKGLLLVVRPWEEYKHHAPP